MNSIVSEILFCFREDYNYKSIIVCTSYSEAHPETAEYPKRTVGWFLQCRGKYPPYKINPENFQDIIYPGTEFQVGLAIE